MEASSKLGNTTCAKVVAVEVRIEKTASGGRAFLSGYNVPVQSVAKVEVEEASDDRD